MSVEKILAERGKTYGNFAKQSALACKIKEPIFAAITMPPLMPDQLEALDMIAIKIARIVTGDPNYIDNWDDIAGYATLVANRLRKDAAK